MKNFEVKKYKPQIIQIASQSLGRQVDFNDIDLKVSLEKGIRFHLTDFLIAEDPDFGSGNFVAVKEIEAGVDILPFLVSRQISVPGVLLRSPRIDIIRNASGVLNVQTIGQSAQGSSQERQAVSPAAALPAIFINSFKIENAEVVVIDKSLDPEIKLAVTQLTLDVRRFSLTNPFDVLLEAAVLSPQKNIRFSGNIQLKFFNNEVKFSETDVTVDLGQLPLDELRTFPLLTGVPLPQVLEGQVGVKIKEAAISDKGLEKLDANVFLANGKVIASEIVPGISLEASHVNLGLENLTLDGAVPARITIKAALYQDQPNVDFSGAGSFNLKTMEVHLTDGQFVTDFGLWPLDKIKTAVTPLKDVLLPERLFGKFQTIIKDAVVSAEGLKTIILDAKLEQGEVSMKEAAPGISFAASHINANISNFGLGAPFGFDVRLAYLSGASNIHAQGTAIFHLEDQSVTLKDTTAQTDLSTLSMVGLKASVAVLKDVPLPEKLKGDLNVAIAQADAGPKGLSALSGNGSLKNWEVKFKGLALPVRGWETNFKMTESWFTIAELQAALGKGQIAAKVDVVDYMTRQDFDFSAEMKGLNLAEIMDQKDAPVKVEGLVYGNIKARGRAADITSITGDGSFEVKEARLKDLNVLKTVLDKISFLPNVSSRVEAKLSENYKQKLKNKDTDIKKITALCVIAGGAATLDPISVESDEFIFSGKCQAGFDQKYTLDGKVKIPTELSLAMGEGIDELKYLYDENSNISLPVYVTGKGADVPMVAVTQTAIDMGKNAMRNESKRQLEKVLNKVLGSGEQALPSGTQNQGQDLSSQEQKSPESQIIDDLLDKIFK